MRPLTRYDISGVYEECPGVEKTIHPNGEHCSFAGADARIAELEAERDKWADQATRNLVAWNDALLQAKQAEAERDAALADAERYRWLREYNTAKHPEVTKAFFLGDANLDAAIDAARGAA